MRPSASNLPRRAASRSGRWFALTAALLLMSAIAHPSARSAVFPFASLAPFSTVEMAEAASDAPPPENFQGGFGWRTALTLALILVLLNAGSWAVAWHYLLSPMRVKLAGLEKRLNNQRDGLTKLEKLLPELSQPLTGSPSEDHRVPSLARKISELESSINQLANEIGPRHESAGPGSAFPPTPIDPLSATPGPGAISTPVQGPTFLPSREELGAWFIQEIKDSPGMEAAAIWERYFARLEPRFHEVRYRLLHWDRAASAQRFQERASDGFTDTGQCWLLQADLQSFLFFPALASPAARKKDLPGCQITTSDDALLNLSKLAEFTPPIVVQATDGWTVRTDGVVAYH